jgi:hypothetical protein
MSIRSFTSFRKFPALTLQVGVCLAVLSCKPAGDVSRVKTLDNFAAGKRVAVNQCAAPDSVVNHEASKLLFADLASRIIWETQKSDAEKTEMLRSMELAFAAIPLEIREFALRLGLKVYVTEGANTQCTSDDIARVGKTNGRLTPSQISALQEDLPKIETCYLWLPPEERVKYFGIGENDDMGQAFVLVMLDSPEAIRHGFVRSFGYIISQVFTDIGYDKGKNQLYYEKDSDPQFKRKKATLAREFIKDAERLGFGSSFSKFASPSINQYEFNEFADFVYAESFDSFFCNAIEGSRNNTRNKMNRDFPNTYAAWNQGFQNSAAGGKSGFSLAEDNGAAAKPTSDLVEVSGLDASIRMLGLGESEAHDGLSLQGSQGSNGSSGNGFFSNVSSGARYIYNGASSATSAVGRGATRLAVGTYNVGRSAAVSAGRSASAAGTAIYNGGKYAVQQTTQVASEGYRRAVNDYNDTRAAVRDGGGGMFANNVSGRLYGAINAAGGAISVIPVAGNIVSAAKNGAEGIAGGSMVRNPTTGRLQPVALSDGERVSRGASMAWETLSALGVQGKVLSGKNITAASTYMGRTSDRLYDVATKGGGGASSFFGHKGAQFAQHGLEAYGNYAGAVTKYTGGDNLMGKFARSALGSAAKAAGSPVGYGAPTSVGKFVFDEVNKNAVTPGVNRVTGGNMIPAP